jgi:hypothetical protein
MTAPAIARLFRSPELRGLAALAAAQGWDIYKRDGGHVSAVNPRNGAQVLMSGTGYVTHGTLAAKRQEFARAGLDLEWSRKAARAARRHRQEARMQVHALDRPDPAPITAQDTVEVARKAGAHQSAGGRFAMVGDLESLDVGGFAVKLGHRADGTWMAYTRDLALRARRRTWYNRDRDALLAHMAEDVVARPPLLEAPEPEPEIEAAWAGLDEHLDPPTPEPGTDPGPAAGTGSGRLDRAAGAWHVAHVEAGEYPLAEGLDALDQAMAPALAALDAAGKSDAAALLRGELTRSPVEAELLALWRRVMRAE